MATQYRKIMEYNNVLWNPESPALIEKMKLQYDRVYGANVLQITFRNVGDLNIYGLTVKVTMKTDSGMAFGEDLVFNYYGMEIEPNQTFGADRDIPVEKDAVQFEVSVTRADLGDGEFYRGDAKMGPMPAPLPVDSLGEFAEGFTERLTKLQPKAKILCAPEKKDNYWRCVCTRYYLNTIDACPFCKVNADDLLSIVPTLKREQRQRELEAARLEKERLAEEERKRQEEEKARLAEEERLRKEREAREEEERIAREKQLEEERLERERREEDARVMREEAEAEMRRAEARKKKILSIVIPSMVGLVLLSLFCIFLMPKVIEKIKPEPTTAAPEISTEAPTVEEPTTEAPTEPTEPTTEDAEEEFLPIVVLGEDLSLAGERTMWRLFGTTEEELGKHDTVLVSAANATRCLGYVYGPSNMEKEAISGMLVIPAEEGSGIDVTLYNISYCSADMYADMLKELGFTDAKVIVAAPDNASGSTAMTGLKILAGQLSAETGDVVGYAVSRMAMNVRSGPSVDYPIYQSIPAGTVISVLEVLENGWFRIVWEGAADGVAYTSNFDGKFYSFGDQ